MMMNASDTDIVVQTRKRRGIANIQSHEISVFEQNQFEKLEREFHFVTFRPVANPIYNCHGFTFASRRTAIFDNKALHNILEDDGYVQVDVEKVLPGDIILYFSQNGDIEHSGIVISKPDRLLKIPKVVSKWGRYKEVIHEANNCPYTFNVKYYRIVS